MGQRGVAASGDLRVELVLGFVVLGLLESRDLDIVDHVLVHLVRDLGL
jgi:hypothetical protein